MEKVWEELKKIEAQAEQIRSEAQDKSMQISTMAQKQAQTLSLNAKNYSAEEIKQLESTASQEINCKRNEKLKESQQTAEKIRKSAEKRMDHATNLIVKNVLGEDANGANYKIR